MNLPFPTNHNPAKFNQCCVSISRVLKTVQFAHGTKDLRAPTATGNNPSLFVSRIR